MAISVVQRNSGIDANGTTGSITVAFGSGNTAGNTIIAVIIGTDSSSALFTSEFTNVTDTQGNTYGSAVFSQWDTTSTFGIKVFVANNIKAGANSVKEPSDTNNPGALFIYEVSGLDTSSPFDQSAFGHQNASNTFTSPTSGTTTIADELLIGAFASTAANTFAAGGSYTNIQTAAVTGIGEAATEEQIIAATGTQSATATTTGTPSGIAAVFTFKAAPLLAGTAPRKVLVTNRYRGPRSLRRKFHVPVMPRVQLNPYTSTIIEDFSAGAINTAKWGTINSNTQASGVLTQSLPAASTLYNNLFTVANYDATNSMVFIKAVSVGDQSIASKEVFFQVMADANNGVFMYVQSTANGGGLAAYKKVAGVNTLLTSTPYDPVAQLWWRLREESGTVNWEYSDTGVSGSWTTLWSAADPVPLTNCTIQLVSGTFASEASSTSVVWDNVNFLFQTSVFVQTLTAALSFTGSFGPTTTRKLLSGGLSFTGTFTKKTSKILTAAVLSFTGAFAKGAVHLMALTAALSFTGSINRRATKSLSGGLSFTGSSPIKTITHKMSAGLSFTGTIKRSTTKILSGGLSFTGNLFKKTLKTLASAVLSFTGSIVTGHVFSKVFTAALSFTGSIVTQKAFVRIFTASLGFTGSFKKQTNKNLTGGLSFTGTFKKTTKKLFSATLGFTGSHLKLITKAPFTASLSFLGSFRAATTPRFKVITRILTSFRGSSELDSTGKTATVDTTNKIADVHSSDTIGEATSSSSSGTLQSENSSASVDTTKTNETLD